MKYFLYTVFAFTLFTSCKTEKKADVIATPERALTILEKVAYAHGYEQWKNVEEFHFTFNVDRGTSHTERSWIWKPKTNMVTAITATDTVTYNRNALDSTLTKYNAGFVNDKYWLLAPFNLIWDQKNITHTHSLDAETPVSKSKMQKLTIVYSNEGGYTPGDAYDFYFEDDFLIREWSFRKGNQEEISIATTWEDYVEKHKIQLGRMHKNAEGDFKLYLSNIKIE